MRCAFLPARARNAPKYFRSEAFWICPLFAVAVQFALTVFAQHNGWSAQNLACATAFNWWFYAVALATISVVSFRYYFNCRREAEAESGPIARIPIGNPLGVVGFLGVVYAANVSWLMSLAHRVGDDQTLWTLLLFSCALGIWHFFRLQAQGRGAGVFLAAQHLAMLWSLVLVVLNLRAGAWFAALPIWVVPTLTAALLVWVGIAVAMTRHQSSINH